MIPVPVPVSLNTVRELIKSVESILQRKQRNEEEKRKHANAALEALLDAVTSTRQYLALVRDHPERQTLRSRTKLRKMVKNSYQA